MPATNYLKNEILDHVFRNSTYTAPTTVYVSLHTAADGGTEVTGSGYARQAVTFGAASSGAISNTGSIEFTPSGGDFGTVLSVGLYDASTAGNQLAYDNVTATSVTDANTYTIAVGDFDLSM